MDEVVLNAPKQRVRLGILAFYFSQGLCFASWASRIPDIKYSLGMDEGTLGTVLFALPVGQLLAMPFSGYIISKYGTVRVMLIAMAFYALMLLGIGFSSSVWQLAAFLCLFGVCGNFLNISVNTQGVYIEDYYRRPIMAFFHGGWSIAGFTGALLGLLAINLRLIPFYHFIVVAILVFVISFLNYKYLFPDVVRIEKPRGKKEKKAFRLQMPEKLLIMLGVIGFCGMASEGAMFDWSGVYFQQIVKAPEQLVPIGYTAFMIMMASGRFMADKLIVEFGRKRLLQVCGLLISSGLFIAVLFPNIVVCTIAFMIVGLGVSSVIPIIYSVAGKESKVQANIALVIVSSVSFVGFLMGPPLIGYIAHASNLRYSYAFIGVFGVCITLLVSRMKVFDKKA